MIFGNSLFLAECSSTEWFGFLVPYVTLYIISYNYWTNCKWKNCTYIFNKLDIQYFSAYKKINKFVYSIYTRKRYLTLVNQKCPVRDQTYLWFSSAKKGFIFRGWISLLKLHKRKLLGKNIWVSIINLLAIVLFVKICPVRDPCKWSVILFYRTLFK